MINVRSLSPSKLPLAARLAVPLAAVAVLAAACGSSSGTTPASSTTGGSSQAVAAASASSAALTIETHSGPDGTYLTDSAGRTLYLWVADTGSTSTCTGSCASAWPPATSGATPTAGSGVTAAQLGVSKRSDGTEQATYDGHPLYYFTGDTSAGQMNGQGSTGFGAAWWIVSPSGSAITTSAGSGSSAKPSGGASASASGNGGGAW
jgi:predicted lipoprotein with Yx(FWY)xxD motif